MGTQPQHHLGTCSDLQVELGDLCGRFSFKSYSCIIDVGDSVINYTAKHLFNPLAFILMIFAKSPSPLSLSSSLSLSLSLSHAHTLSLSFSPPPPPPSCLSVPPSIFLSVFSASSKNARGVKIMILRHFAVHTILSLFCFILHFHHPDQILTHQAGG